MIKKSSHLERVAKQLEQVRRRAVETKRAVQEAKGALFGTSANLNSRQETGGGAG